jgi:hypothetical protein
VKRLRQCGALPWDDITDGSAVNLPAPGFASVDGWARSRLNPASFSRDLRHGQPVVVEIYSESAELTPLIHRVAMGYGVRTYSGRGSGGPALARETAQRIVGRWNDDGARTLILGIGDLDLAGVQNVMRPHIEHVGAFVLAACSEHGDPMGSASEVLDFRRVAITPGQAIAVNTNLGVPLGSLVAYRDSGECDWTRDVRLLKTSPKTETEALDPATLRDLIREALEEALDMGQIARVTAEEEIEREGIQPMRDLLGLDDDET